MVRMQAREVSLDLPGQPGAEIIDFPERAPGPDEVVEMRERLAEVRALPVRQQRIVWLQGAGFDYREIGARTGDTRRTVERQLLRAKRKLKPSP